MNTTHSMQQRLAKMNDWRAPDDWIKITVIDAHTGGEPLRVVTGGLPELPGKNILEKRRYMKDHLDQYRKLMMWEPRGHADMYGCIMVEPVSPEADFGVLFLHNEGYSTMCGHGIIAIAKVAVETGLVKVIEPKTKIGIDSPAGLVTAYAKVKKGIVQSVYFHNVPSYVAMKDQVVSISGVGDVKFDIAFGGAYYAFVDADELGLKMTLDNNRKLIEVGMAIKREVMKKFSFKHPFQEDLSFLYGTIFTGAGITPGTDSRNVCIFAEGEVDRSPTGTGVSARMALMHDRGLLKVGDKPVIIESIVGSKFICSIKSETSFGPHKAVIPQVEGTAFISGKSELLVDPGDLFQNGFFIR